MGTGGDQNIAMRKLNIWPTFVNWLQLDANVVPCRKGLLANIQYSQCQSGYTFNILDFNPITDKSGYTLSSNIWHIHAYTKNSMYRTHILYIFHTLFYFIYFVNLYNVIFLILHGWSTPKHWFLPKIPNSNNNHHHYITRQWDVCSDRTFCSSRLHNHGAV